MRALLSTIGSRGDVQPLVALALELRALGHEVRLVAPPDFGEWIEGLGLSLVTIGPELRGTGRSAPAAAPPTAEQRQQMLESSIAAQFKTLLDAAEGCDVVLGATALQIAAPSVAERLGLPYVFTAYCPAVLPSRHHAPPVLGTLGDGAQPNPLEYEELWNRDALRFNQLFGKLLNSHRASMGLAAVSDVRSHVFTQRPWLAADPTLGPWSHLSEGNVWQSGAWLMPDATPLPEELERFLQAGEPPVYFGFGSIRAPEGLSQAMLDSARSLGRRAVVLRGWAELSVPEGDQHCVAVGDVNHQALFKRVAAVVHHGGAGTTTAAALAGVPQIVVPQMYDQHYWAQRVEALGIGVAHPPATPTATSLAEALGTSFRSDISANARDYAALMRIDGARLAAQRLGEIALTRGTSG